MSDLPNLSESHALHHFSELPVAPIDADGHARSWDDMMVVAARLIRSWLPLTALQGKGGSPHFWPSKITVPQGEGL